MSISESLCLTQIDCDIFKEDYAAVQSQKVVSACLASEQILPFGFAEK